MDNRLVVARTFGAKRMEPELTHPHLQDLGCPRAWVGAGGMFGLAFGLVIARRRRGPAQVHHLVMSALSSIGKCSCVRQSFQKPLYVVLFRPLALTFSS
jgi:hypothetical protein